MTVGRVIAFLLGAAILIVLTVYAGAGAVVHALAALRFTGLAAIALLHLPVVALLGWAWWQIGHDLPGATRRKFAWARLVRDAAAEVLPFSQIGGFVLGVRALHLGGVRAIRGALSMSVDLVMELWAKLPYFLAGLIALFAVAPNSHLIRALPIALALTALVVAIPFFFRARLRQALEVSAHGDRAALAEPRLARRSERVLRPDIRREAALSRPRSPSIWSCWFIGAAETWVIFALMGMPVSPAEALAIDSLVVGLRTFGFLVPAAAGVQEASYVLVCALFGLPAATAVAVSLIRRARDLADRRADAGRLAISGNPGRRRCHYNR